MIRIQSLKKAYGDHVAVDGLDLSIEPGETFGLLGPNGAGKTTTIHCAIGVLRPDAGTIDIGGAGSPTTPAVRRRIGVAPQELALYAELSADENILFFGRIQGLSGAELKQRAEASLDAAGLLDRRKDRVSTYSGGMKRRLNLACALVHDPDVLLLDEPTVGVDPQSRNRLFENVNELKSRGKTVVYTTHYMEEAARLCDRVGIVDHGQLLAVGKVSDLIAEHGGMSVVEIRTEGEAPAGLNLPAAIEGDLLQFESPDPFADIERLRSGGLRFESVRVRQPDLESVFLKLTGRSLRDS